MAYIGKRPQDTFPSNNAVTSTIIAANAVSTSEIALNSITTNLIADNAVTDVKISENSITARAIAASTITAAQLNGAIIGTDQIVNGAVTTAKLGDNSVTSAKIVNGTIVAADIANATITTTQIAANTIATGNVADNAIDGTKIAQNSILTKHIDDGQVGTDQLADDAVTAAKITDNAVGAAALNISGNGTAGQALLSDGDGSFSYGAGGKTDEEIQDLVGAMFSSNTETGITATYEDSDGTIDLVVGTLNQDTTGNAATATALETARTIHGVSFDGTANIDLSEVVQDTAGAMFSSNTETNVTATYQDGDGTIDLAVEQQLNNTSAPYYHKITVTVVSSGGNKYALDGGTQAIAKLTPSVVYRFDQSDSSNSSHPLRIGTAANGSEISSGYTIYNKVGTPGSAGAYTEIAFEQDAPDLLYYFCSNHSGMGAQIAVANEAALTQTLTNKTLTSPNITGLSLGGTAVTSTAAELNILDGVTSTTAELNILDGVTSTTAELNILDGVTSTATELNIMDGDTSASSTTLADADRVVVNDNGTMKQVALTDFETYFESALDTLTSLSTITTSGNATIGGNLTVNGTTTTLNTTNSVVSDRLIELGNGTTGSPANDMGIVMERGDSNNAFMGFDESADKFIVGTGTFTGASTGDLTITTGTLVANLEGNVTGNLTGTASAIADNSVTSAKIVNGTIVAADIANATITTTQIAANTIATGNVADNAIDSTKIAQNSILTKHIDDGQVTTDQLGADAVTAAKLADDAVVTANIVDANVTTAKIADDAITAAKITDNAVGAAALNISGNGTSGQAILSDGDGSFSYGSSGKTTEEIQDIVGAMFSSNTETNITVTYQDSDGTIDLVVPNELSSVTALGTLTTLTVDDIKINGTQIGHTSDEDAMSIASNGVVTFTQIPVLPNDSITQAFIADDAVGADQLASSAVVTASIVDDAVTQAKIADDAVGADQLAANSVVSASIVNGSIVSADIAANTIATSNIADNAVDGTKIASNSILTRHIDDNQVTGDQISDNVVLSGTGSVTVPKGTTAQRSGSAQNGMFRYNTTTDVFEGYKGGAWGSIGGSGSNGFLTDIFDGTTTPATDGSRVAFTMSQAVTDEKFVMVFIDGVYQAHDAYSVSGSTLTMADAPVAGRVLTVHSISATVSGDGLNVDNFSGDGSDTTFTLSINPSHENNTQVYIDGVYQFKNTYSVSGTTLTFSSAPPNGTSIEVMTHSQTAINTFPATGISGLTEVTAVGADHVMIFDATDSALKKALVSDFLDNVTLSNEQVQDLAGGMFSSNTETGIAATYQDSDGTIDLVVNAAQPTVTSLGTLTTLTVDDITINGSTISDAADLTIDVGGDIILDADGDNIMFKAGGTDMGGFVFTPSSGAIELDSSNDFTVDAAGNIILDAAGTGVGINQTSPNAALHITGSGDTKIIIESGSDEQFITGHSGGLNYGVVSGDSHTFVVGGTDAVFIDSGSARIKQTALTSSSNAVAWDAKAAANAFHLTTENTTFSAPSNAVEGAVISVEIAQGGTARTIAWNTVFEFAASTAPTVTATANKTDIFTFRYNGSVWQEIGRVQNMAQT